MKKIENDINIAAPWGNISGLTFGDASNPPVLIVHGKLDACSGFRPLINLLPDNFFYVAVDLPGNGRSDALPPGVKFTVIDLVPTVDVVRRYFGWDKFIYMGHSLGSLIGKYFNIAYPGYITRVVELDPIPAHHNWHSTRENLGNWYRRYYASFYDPERYKKLQSGVETAPTYSYEKAQELVMESRNLTKEASEHVLERSLVPAANGLYRFSHDQRMKDVTVLPFSGDILGKIYTTATTPTFAVIAKGVIDRGFYKNVPFLTDDKLWPNKNYRFIIVDGTHDVHIYNPKCMAEDVSKFLLEHFKSKL